LKKIIHISLYAFLAISVLTLNISGMFVCSSLMTNEDCCHSTKLVKPCCVKNLKITQDERISGHCGCKVKESAPMADLYNDFKSYNINSGSKVFQYHSTNENGSYSEFTGIINSEYSPPPFDSKDKYLTNLSIRI